jgi:hypothetical protein
MGTCIEGITEKQLLEAYRIAAEIVSRYGDAYLPVFERLHMEVQKLNATSDLKSIALIMASSNINDDRKE